MKKDRIIVWNNPLCLDEGCVINSVVRAWESDVIRWYKHMFPERNYTDEEALNDFMIVNWAEFEEGDKL